MKGKIYVFLIMLINGREIIDIVYMGEIIVYLLNKFYL